MSTLTYPNGVVAEDDDGAALDYLHHMLGEVLELGASDLHLTVGVPPAIRLHGELEALRECPPLTPKETERIIQAFVPADQFARFTEDRELDMEIGRAHV